MRSIQPAAGRRFTAALLALAAITACTTDPVTGEQRVNRTALGAGVGALGGFLAGDVIGGRHDRTEKLVGLGVGALAGGAVGAYMDKQERELRARTAGTGVGVVRDGDTLRLEIPAGITFDTNSYAVKPEFRRTLDRIATTLADNPQTIIDVYGHTDATGGDAINVPLSENRARSVADYLASRNVQPARIATRGLAAAQPVASNDTPAGRAENRRVEIKIVPVTTDRG